MNKSLIVFIVIVIAVSIISSIFLGCYVIKRKQKKQEPDVHQPEQNDQNDVGVWKFLIFFGVIFISISSAMLVFQTIRMQNWVKTPAVISEMQTTNSGAKKKQHIYVSYEFNGQTFENISTSTSVKQNGSKNPIKVGDKIVLLVNPDAPSQIMAYYNIIYGISIALLLVGLLLCFTGIYNLIQTRAGKSKWRTAEDSNILVTKDDERKNRFKVKIYIAVFVSLLLLFVYCVASFSIFLFFVVWVLFLAVFGIWTKHKEKKQENDDV